MTVQLVIETTDSMNLRDSISMDIKIYSIIMFVIVVCVCCVSHKSASASILSTDPDLLLRFYEYLLIHRKNYTNEPNPSYRFRLWMDNREAMREHNIEYEKGLHSFGLGQNVLSDRSPKEIDRIINDVELPRWTRLGSASGDAHSVMFQKQANPELPRTTMWRIHGCTEPIYDQGACGSSWAFAAANALECQMFMDTGEPMKLSEQELVDCERSPPRPIYADKCFRGHPRAAFKYIVEHGLATNQSHPYEARGTGSSCVPRARAAHMSQYVRIESGDEEALKQALVAHGPIVVVLDASSPKFWRYADGVYADSACSSNIEDGSRAMLLVGYGTDAKHGDFWWLKNSLSWLWGEDGYMRLARNRHNMCGIASDASLPVVG